MLFSESDTVFFGGGLERTQIKPGTNMPAIYLALCAEEFGYTSMLVLLTIGWSRDSRDSALVPNAGLYQRLNTEVSGWGRTLPEGQLPNPATTSC